MITQILKSDYTDYKQIPFCVICSYNLGNRFFYKIRIKSSLFNHCLSSPLTNHLIVLTFFNCSVNHYHMTIWARKKKWYFIPLLVFVVITALLTIFGNRGLIRVYKLSKERDSLKAYNGKIKTENDALGEEIQRLKTDNKYIEMIARKEMGMIGKNEVVYQFEK